MTQIPTENGLKCRKEKIENFYDIKEELGRLVKRKKILLLTLKEKYMYLNVNSTPYSARKDSREKRLEHACLNC